MKRNVYCKVALVAILVLLVGLSWPIKAQAQSKVNLKLWIAEARPKYKEIVLEAAQAFTKQHPNIEVKVSQMLAKDVLIKWPAAAATGTLPDISWGYAHYCARNHDMAGGGLLPVDEIIAELGGVKKFALLEDWKYKGHYRGIPVWRLPVWLTYRADLFAKAGLKEPKTWADVLEAAKKLNDPDNNFYGIGMAGAKIWDTRYAFGCVLYGYGGQTMDKNCRPVYNSPETIAAIKMFTSLFKYAPPGAVEWKYMGPIRAFSMGRTAMCISYATVLSSIKKSSPDLAKHVRLALPYGSVPNVTSQSSRGWTIFATTKHPDEAKMFVKHLLKPKTVGDFCTIVPLALAPGYIHPEVYQRIRDNAVAKIYPTEVVDRILSQVRGFTAGVGACGPNKWSGIMNSERIIEAGINSVLTQGWTAEKAAAWTQEQMERIIRENP